MIRFANGMIRMNRMNPAGWMEKERQRIRMQDLVKR